MLWLQAMINELDRESQGIASKCLLSPSEATFAFRRICKPLAGIRIGSIRREICLAAEICDPQEPRYTTDFMSPVRVSAALERALKEAQQDMQMIVKLAIDQAGCRHPAFTLMEVSCRL